MPRTNTKGVNGNHSRAHARTAETLIPADDLRDMVIEEKLTDDEIGERYDCLPYSVAQWRIKNGLKKRRGGRQTLSEHTGFDADSANGTPMPRWMR